MLRQALGTQKAQVAEGVSSSVGVERLVVQVKTLEAQTEELREVVRDQAIRGKEIQRAILSQGQQIEESLIL